MAVRAKTVARLTPFRADAWTVTWEGLTQTTSDTGDPFEMTGAADRSVQVIGTFGAGGNCRIQGSNNGTDWATLTDPQGNALDFTTAKIEAVTELTKFIRPNITAGDGTTDLDVILLVRRMPA